VMPIYLLLVQQAVHEGNQVADTYMTLVKLLQQKRMLRIILILTMVKIPLRQINKRCLATIFHGEGGHIVEKVCLRINVLEKLLAQVMYYRCEGF
jgi:hypothetical protein